MIWVPVILICLLALGLGIGFWQDVERWLGK